MHAKFSFKLPSLEFVAHYFRARSRLFLAKDRNVTEPIGTDENVFASTDNEFYWTVRAFGGINFKMESFHGNDEHTGTT